MRTERRLHGIPTNRTEPSGKCKRPRCHGCHFHPLNKSMRKCKGSRKAFALDIASNHTLHDWSLHRHYLKRESAAAAAAASSSAVFDFDDYDDGRLLLETDHHPKIVRDAAHVLLHTFHQLEPSPLDDDDDDISSGSDWCHVGLHASDYSDDDDWCFC